MGKNTAYTDEVVSLYLNKDDTKVIGRLLPTNPFEVLKSENNRVLLKIDGYVNPKAPSVIYFNDSQRIIVAAFSKNTKLNFSQRITGKNGKWDKVSLEIWADKKEFVMLSTKKKNLQLTLGLQFSVLWPIEQVLIKKTDG